MNDSVMQHALAIKAYERNWSNVLQQYLATHPDDAQLFEDLAIYEQSQQSQTRKFEESQAFSPPTRPTGGSAGTAASASQPQSNADMNSAIRAAQFPTQNKPYPAR